MKMFENRPIIKDWQFAFFVSVNEATQSLGLDIAKEFFASEHRGGRQEMSLSIVSVRMFGKVYNSPKYADGSSILTSELLSLERIEDESFGEKEAFYTITRDASEYYFLLEPSDRDNCFINSPEQITDEKATLEILRERMKIEVPMI